ncbi:pyridoxal phosphate-dependent decarboxylase family protein [Williamsia phyllosphaerae]|uniref:Aspartate aminotransferase family protein n=1 Tax=Williamsia phyllosphaerae TaxID=885042 RepID=A0ABQ1V0L4_9NOCA|nr:aminotransferase class V-fold PLP-dependent enzyme [Williamsia phyllosphaerae]GGF30258.1 aspartate aminotransferase family protein [Williamsia phyllosphaerae]
MSITELARLSPSVGDDGHALDELLRAVSRYSTNYLATDHPGPTAERSALAAAFAGPLQGGSIDAVAVLDELIVNGEPGLLHSGAPTFLGFVMGGAHPISVATEWLTSIWDQCGALYATSPTASVVEDTVARWLVSMFGLPQQTSVGITSGCAMSNLSGLAAARHAVLDAAGWDVERDGLFGAPVPRVLVSRGCHTTVFRALRLLGMAGQIHLVDTDDQGRMSLPALQESLRTTDGPLIVCGQVGNVDTGSVDPMPEICAAAHDAGGWVHVDAAFGMWAAAGHTVRHQVTGLEFADSWATDAHKWLNVPYDCGLVFCAHPEAHRAALRTTADYLTAAADGARDPADYTPDLSRRARALVLWATLRHLGTDGVADLIDRSCAHAATLASRLSTVPGVRIVNDVVLNQVLVTFDAPGTGPTRAHLDAIVARLQHGGTGWASPTTWRGLPTLRLSVCNWQTTAGDIDACASAIIAAHRATTDHPIHRGEQS